MQSITACDSVEINGVTYTSSQLVIDTFSNAANCDSIVTTNLTINNSASSSQNITACDSAEINGVMYTSSQIVIDSLETPLGCDSIVTTHLTINYTTSSSQNVTACASAEINGVTYTSSQVVIDTLTNISGCDSIVTTYLTVIQHDSQNQLGIMVDSVPEAIESAELCAGSSFEFTAWGVAGSVTYDFYKISNGIDNLMSSSSVTSSGGANGAVASYTATDLEDGDSVYVVTTDANGCTVGSPAKIGISVLANPSLAVSIPEMCEGSTFDITTSGADSVIFLINGGIVQSGTVNSYNYTATIGDRLAVKGYNGACSTTFDESVLNIEALPEVSLTNDALNNTVCRDSVVNFVAS